MHAFSSSQMSPSDAAMVVHPPFSGKHSSRVQGFPSSMHWRSIPLLHLASWHDSPMVQGFASSHGAPFVFAS